MDDERQKKIEAGKLKVAELKRKRKNSKQKSSPKVSNSKSSVECPRSSFANEPEASDSSSNTSINNLKDTLEMPTSKSETETMSNSESALLISEDMSDDADLLLDDKQAALFSCLEQKLVKYQNAAKQKDVIIQKLTHQLASSMNAVESSELSRTEGEEKLKTEINMLHLQIKEATGMIVKQNSKIESREIVQATDCDKTRISEIGIQVEIKNHENFSDQQDSAVQTLHISQLVNSTNGNVTENSMNNQCKYIGDSLSITDRINSLNIITRLIESHVYNSSQSINESRDFSPSKFQRLYLKRLNSSETNQNNLELFENENQATDINYVDVENDSSVKSRMEYPPTEKMRSHLVPKDIADIADFLMSEMNHINLSLQSLRSGPEGDCDDVALVESMGPITVLEPSLVEKSNVECCLQEILQQKSKLESKIIQLKQMDKELQLQRSRQKSIESDTLTAFDDNLIMEEPPLSCVSLLSLTDSEYKTECMTTDSEVNFSRKVSLDSSRLIQDGDFCPNCDKFYELVKEKYDDHMCLLKEALENSTNNEKSEIIKRLEQEIQKLKTEKNNLHSDMEKQVELLCQEQELKIQHILDDQHKKLVECEGSQNEWTAERENLVLKISNLEGELTRLRTNLQDAWSEKTNIEISLQKQIADLVEEHQEDLEAQKLSSSELFSQEKHKREAEYLSSLEVLKKLHKEELENIKEVSKKELADRESCLKTEYSGAIALLKSDHLEECAAFQKRIDQLLEQKCELYSKTTQEYEAILKRNHKVLVKLCNQLRCKLYNKKKKIAEDSCKSINSDLDVTLSDTLDEVNKNIEEGIFKFLDQSYFSTNDQLEIFEETQYMSLENIPVFEDMHSRDKKNLKEKCVGTEKKPCTTVISKIGESVNTLDPEYMQLLQEEVRKVQADFQNDVALYIEINEKLHKDVKTLQKQNQELTDNNKKLESELVEKEKESQMNAMGGRSINDVAQTNSRLLHVLSDLVKTFLDIEQEINRHLYEHGLVPSRSTTLGQHEDETGHSVGSREDFASLSFGECPNLELAEDGPDLTPRAWDLFSVVGSYDNEMEGEDVVLGASRRLRAAVDHLLNLLTRALDNQQSQDLKLLLKRNEELSQELNEESKCRDQVHMELVTAESTVRKLESEKQNLHDIITDLRDSNDALKREIMIEKNKVNYFNQEKEAANDEIQTLKNQCELLASRLGDPEKMSTNKTLKSTDTVHENKELLQENSRLSSEKHNVQISLSMERQSFLDRMQLMEIALDNLNAEKDDLMEKKCKEIRDLKAEMEAMEKQLQSNKKFIEEQAQEREQEREEYLKELSKMQEHVREKEKIQSNEAQLRKEIESLEQDLRLRIEDHQNTMQKKDAIEIDLRQYVDKVNDLRDIIAEFEEQLQLKSKIEIELRQKLANLTETVNDQERRNSLLGDEIALSKTKVAGIESTEQVQTLKEKLACQSQEIEEMSQNQTLLQELRGQIHFLEAKVEQRAKQLEALHLSSNSPFQSADASPSSQDSESIHLPCEDGWEMSPRSIHWLEMRRLEEKIGRLVHIDEELIKKNKDLEQKLKQLQNIHSECEQENSILQEKLTEQMIQVSTLKSHMDEQKHKPPSPHASSNISKKLEELQDAYQAVTDKNKELFSEVIFQ